MKKNKMRKKCLECVDLYSQKHPTCLLVLWFVLIIVMSITISEMNGLYDGSGDN